MKRVSILLAFALAMVVSAPAFAEQHIIIGTVVQFVDGDETRAAIVVAVNLDNVLDLQVFRNSSDSLPNGCDLETSVIADPGVGGAFWRRTEMAPEVIAAELERKELHDQAMAFLAGLTGELP